MNYSWIKTFITSFLWIAVIASARAVVAAESCVGELKTARCEQGCCTNGECGCSMAPAPMPEAPKPALPSQTSPACKLMPLGMPVAENDICPLADKLETRAVTTPEAARPHRPPALTLHCALLI
jgi:hypothetical protein